MQCPEFFSSSRNNLAGAIGHRALLQPTGDRGTATAMPMLARQGFKDVFPRRFFMILLGHPEIKSSFWTNGLGFPSTPNSQLLLSLPAPSHCEIHNPLPLCTHLHNWNLPQWERRVILASSVFPWLSYVTEKLIFVLLLTSPGWFQQLLLRISFLE